MTIFICHQMIQN